MIIKSYDVNLDNINWHDYLDNPVVGFNFQHDINSVIGKAVHISQKRNIVNVEFMKDHPIVQAIKKSGAKTELRMGYIKSDDPDLPHQLVSLDIVLVKSDKPDEYRRGKEKY